MFQQQFNTALTIFIDDTVPESIDCGEVALSLQWLGDYSHLLVVHSKA